MNVSSPMRSTPCCSSDNQDRLTAAIHDKDIYHKMMMELIITSSHDKDSSLAKISSRKKSTKTVTNLDSFFRKGNKADDVESDDDDDGFDDNDTIAATMDIMFHQQEVNSKKTINFNKNMKYHHDDFTDVTVTETDCSLNGSSWHSSTSQKSTNSSSTGTSRSFLPPHLERLHAGAISSAEPPSVKVFEWNSAVMVTEASNTDNTADGMAAGLKTRRLLGEGFFGKVYLVGRGDSSAPSLDSNNEAVVSNFNSGRQYYALKKLSKYHLLCEDQIHTVLREKHILQLCHHHPGIVTLYTAYQDASYLYFLQSYIPGGELFTFLHNEQYSHILSERSVQFYAACITDALWYLHCGMINQPIVFRDLKPENIMINAKGYPVMIDFGYAKILTPTQPQNNTSDDENCEKAATTAASISSMKTYTLCGTSKYLSPEMIEGKGHNCSTDYWSLGIVVYELLSAGEHPFEFYQNMDDLSLYRSIVDADYIPLPDEMSAAGMDFVDQLLNKDSTLRIGSTERHDYNPVLSHTWLRHWDITALRQQTHPAPWIPALENSIDTKYFDGVPRTLSGSDHDSDDSFTINERDSCLTMKEQALFADF
jgi:protein kinase A